MNKEQEFIKEAIRLADENVRTNNGGPFGAVIVRDGKIIGRGVNTVTKDNDPTAHAEVNAIRDASKNLESFQLDGCEIYASSEPCPMCLGAIYWARPEKLFFAAGYKDAADAGFDDSLIYNDMQLPPPERKIKCKQICRDDALHVFEKWKAAENKVEY